ncbi:hypothetical protein BDF14DRAFT_413316 [Spinellus fusiger]|nr:hypothetical protein BDF14DRAFT_413316 [Spinellus fusiger]
MLLTYSAVKPPQPRKRGRPRTCVRETFPTKLLARDVLISSRSYANASRTLFSKTKPSVVEQMPSAFSPTPEKRSNEKEAFEDSKSIPVEHLPLTPSSLPMDDSDEEEEAEEEEESMDLWTLEEDKEILAHGLGFPLANKWREVESEFDERHRADMCYERWMYLKRRLVGDILCFQVPDPVESMEPFTLKECQ